MKRTGALAFDVTPEEALPCAEKLLDYLRKSGQKPSLEKSAFEGAPYRTTIFIPGRTTTLIYEVQGRLDFHPRLQNYTQWLAANRKSAELYLVSDANSPTTATLFVELRTAGAGLMILRDDGTFDVALAARNPALQVTPDPDLKLGELKGAVLACIHKFNTADRKDALRDLCELVEGQTKKTLLLAARKGSVTVSLAAIEAADFSNHINMLGSTNVTAPPGGKPLIDSKLKDDLHSFRGARNLVDHPCLTKHAEVRRQRQFPERILMGARIAADLLAVRRRIRSAP